MMTPGRLAWMAIRGMGSNQHASWPGKSPWHGSCCGGPNKTGALDRRGSVTEDIEPVVLGPSERNAWRVSGVQADLVRRPAPALPIRLQAEPKDCVIDLARTAMIVVDMQNDFCTPGGWLASIGVDVTPAAPRSRRWPALLPALRSAKVPVIWVNWGNRPDRLNLSPAAPPCLQSDRQWRRPGRSRAGHRRGGAGEGQLGGGDRRRARPAPDDIRVDKCRMSAASGTRRSTASCAISA